MRFLIVCIFVLFGSITAYSTKSSSAVLPAPLTEQLEQAQQAVWMISSSSDKSSGTAFFVSPRHVVTNWHVIHNQNMASLSLQQEGNEQKLSIKRLVSVSVFHDLALLETGESSASHLTVRKDVVSDKEDLFLPGYPGGVFKYTLKTGPLKDFKDGISIHFSVNRTDLRGNSGGPVLDANNRVVGVISEGVNNYIHIIKGSILREFIGADRGSNYEGQSSQTFIEEEINNLQEQAKRGSQIAQCKLAIIYYDGEGGEKNPSSARKWFHPAAVQGDAIAQDSLGLMYLYGKGGEKNPSLARKWFQRSAKQGYPPAQYHLGVMYDKGEGVEKNPSLAFEWYRQAAVQGYAEAQYHLGVMYDKGEEVEKNPSLAFEWYRQAAVQGYVEAQYHLGVMYYYGKGGEKNPSLAFEWYRRAAEQGHAAAQYHLGVMYGHGMGVRKDLSLARKWFHLAAKQSFPLAQQALVQQNLE